MYILIKFSQGIMNPLAYDFSFIKQNPTCAENVSAKRAKQKNLIGLSPCANSICPGANSIVCRERHLFSLPSSCIIKSLLLQHMAYDHAQVRPHRTELKRCMSVHSELSAAFRTVQCCVEDKKWLDVYAETMANIYGSLFQVQQPSAEDS